jgi:hypothetical protein
VTRWIAPPANCPALPGLAPVGGAGSAGAIAPEVKMTKASKRDTAQSTSTATTRKKSKAPKAKPRETKRAQLIGMLKAPKGADIAQISQKLGWQRHTTRAALTGLRKAGFTIDRSTSNGGGGSVYHITAGSSAEPAG